MKINDKYVDTKDEVHVSVKEKIVEEEFRVERKYIRVERNIYIS